MLEKVVWRSAVLDDVEGQLLSADIGLEATDQIIGNLREKLDRKQLGDGEAFMTGLKQTRAAGDTDAQAVNLQIPESGNSHAIGRWRK